MSWRCRGAGLLGAGAIVLLSAGTATGADRPLEYSVKATFLYKFASFVEWPRGSFVNEASPFQLCVVGADPYGGRIAEAVRGQSVGQRPIVLRQIESISPSSRCHAAFISGTGSQSVAAALRAVAGTPTLTLTDSALSDEAGVIHFVIVRDRVSFDIDSVAAERNRLIISSKLLALARNLSALRAGGGR